MNGHVAAIILAAGLSERMGEFKPLLPLGGVTALERCVNLFRLAGAADVRVVIGHRGEELLPLLSILDVRIVDNPRYREGMFSSALAGLATIESDVDAFFVLPADVPLVRPSTVRRMLVARQVKVWDVVYPVFHGERGHPPLIAGGRARDIVQWRGDGELKRALARWESTALGVSVADGNILLDMDTVEEYRSMMEKADRLEVPTPEECVELLERVFCVGDDIIRHGRAVAKVAVCLAEALNRTGYCLDIPLIEAAALLHDIAKGKPDHARLGARLLQEEGFAAVAAPVAAHMDMKFSDGNTIGAEKLLYLADKMVMGEREVTLEERFRVKQERYRDEPEILARINGRLRAAQDMKRRIESCLGRPLEEVLTS
jgi:CTP:molybdopterin cytidylyltransferase MocA/HD superfamily phosphohydrolase YqeK